MPIQLAKTLQTVDYTLYIITDIDLPGSDRVLINQRIYQSKGHFDDDFLPIILKRQVITNQARVNTIRMLIRTNYDEAINAVETFLTANVPYYQGGVVV